MAKRKAIYGLGDFYTTSKAGATGRIVNIESIKPNLTRLYLQMPNNARRIAMVKIGA
jgi:hypothetical protein